MKRALICGVTGQDGAYLAELLLDKGYEVWGTSRDAHMASVGGLQALGIADRILHGTERFSQCLHDVEGSVAR